MAKKTKPTKSQIEVIMSDWLGNSRDDRTFISKNTKGAIKKNISEKGHFSDYFLGDTSSMDEEDILRQSREIAQGVVNGMTEKQITVILGRDMSFTNGEKINIATDYFDDKSLSVGEKIDILTGFSIHEACHINHTDFGLLQNAATKEPEIAPIKKSIMNILEDERIEQLLGQSTEDGGDGMPGLSDYLGCCKKHCFGTYEKDLSNESPDLNKRVPKFMNSILKAVRYPTALTEKEVLDNFDELDAVRKILTPFPKSAKGVENAASEIINVMRQMIKDDLENKQKEQKNSEGNQSSNNQQQASGNGSSSSSPSPSDSNSKNEQESSQNSQQKSSGQNGVTKKDVEKALKDAVNDFDTQKLLRIINKNINQPKGGDTKNANILQSRAMIEYVNGESEKNETGGGRNEINFIRKVKGDKSSYDLSVSAVKKWIPAMAKALRCKTIDRDYELMGMKSGKLNTNKLVSLKTGNDNIFTKSGTITTDSACICILIDESGSMRNGERIRGARDTAVLINEAVKHIPNLELFVYGFTDQELNIYCERKKADRWALGSTKASGGTPTAAAMETAAGRIRKLTPNNCLMLVITDGYPNNSEATMQQDKLLSKRGFVPIGIDIAGAEQTSKIFKESISTKDMKQLAPYLGHIVRKKLSKSIKSHDSM